MICELCDKDLKSFFILKKDLIYKQQLLYQLLPLTNDLVHEPDQDLTESLETKTVAEIEKTSQEIEQNSISVPKQKKKLIEEDAEEQNTKEKFQCDECDQLLSSKIILQRHTLRVSKPYNDHVKSIKHL